MRFSSLLLALWVSASPLPGVSSLVLSSPPSLGDDSIRARLKACLRLGDMSCVVDQYLLLRDIGRVPAWLVSFQNAFTAASRRAGECVSTARLIHEGLRQLGEKPTYLRLTVEGRYKLLGFDELANGERIRTHQLAVTGRHVAVQWEGRIVDAYTGLVGLPLQEYMNRLVVHPTSRIAYEAVSEP
ncbi:hypothetical protein [Archangium primigenium]|uniref:hypothetical protein n=1 Tax=[Archangium] primigenium TaxID=2792470 RepID=UPI00195E3194|nr:hypothetical protein [Archangium primigenium]MBM7111985.1 hypothetical protein [Archangium primigenium]